MSEYLDYNGLQRYHELIKNWSNNNHYQKSETYTKSELNNRITDIENDVGVFKDEVRGLVDTSHQEYVTVETFPELPTPGSKDTIYRVSNYNGSTSQIDNTVYSEYAWDGTLHIFLCVKSQISEVFDISEYNNSAKYANLSEALNSVPQSLQKGGMSIKFVQNSDNNYVQYRLIPSSWSTDVDDWQSMNADKVPTMGSKDLITSGAVFEALLGVEKVVIVATANEGSVSEDAEITVKVGDDVIATGTGTLTVALAYDLQYSVECSRVYDYLTPETQTFTASQSVRNVTCAYTYIERDIITLDQTVTDPATMITGDVQGDVIKQIRANSHLYLGTPITQEGDTEGTELICQLDDEDSTKYSDGTTAVLDGSEGDQWLKLPIFWWKITAIGDADELGAHDQYSFAYAISGEPDPTWNKWEGDKNMIGAKEMTVIDNVGHSISGGESTGSFTRGTGNTHAAANNLGCQQVTWEWQWMMCMLFYAWYGNTNSQAVCGIGSESITRTLGVTDELGMTDTTPAQATALTSARFWGLEAWWNEKAEWMGNVTSSDLTLTIKDMNTKQNRTVAGFVNCEGNAGFITRMKITDKGDFIPVAVGGTDSTSYCDGTNSRTGSSVLFRSGGSAVPGGGVACVFAFSATSGSGEGVGSRLAFNGVVTEAESVNAYKAAIAAAGGE